MPQPQYQPQPIGTYQPNPPNQEETSYPSIDDIRETQLNPNQPMQGFNNNVNNVKPNTQGFMPTVQNNKQFNSRNNFKGNNQPFLDPTTDVYQPPSQNYQPPKQPQQPHQQFTDQEWTYIR